MNRRHVVCICGSGRFWTEILQAAADLTLRGNIVLSPNFNMKDGRRSIHPAEKNRLDELHLDKIDMADEVFVVNRDGYVGDSTGKEIRHARATHKRVTFSDTERGDSWIRANVVRSGDDRIMSAPAEKQALSPMHRERDQLLEDVCVLLDQCEAAWGVVANANGGAWANVSDDWRKAAEGWRDRWHAILAGPIMKKTEKIRALRQLQARIARIEEAARVGRPLGEISVDLAAIHDLFKQAWLS